tara:strand:+ start:1910 stop:2020 length:111 start_codon:yes stop_codon:yes gene_type:complete
MNLKKTKKNITNNFNMSSMGFEPMRAKAQQNLSLPP